MSFAWYLPAWLILAALLLDLALGDPDWAGHPVRLIGALAAWGEGTLWRGSPRAYLARGALLVGLVGGASALAALGLLRLAAALGPWWAGATAVVLAWTTVAARELDRAAQRIEAVLEAGRLEEARRLLPALVGRDTQELDLPAMVRATIESLAESTCDGVVAPLFWLFVGGPLAAMVYRAVNTLDSMVGHRDEHYLYFGRAAARLDDLLNFVPARLTAGALVGVAGLLLGRAQPAWQTMRRDAASHPSPNAGYPEAAMAGALGLELGGSVAYEGSVEARPRLGRPERVAAPVEIRAARFLVWYTIALATLFLAAARSLVFH